MKSGNVYIALSVLNSIKEFYFLIDFTYALHVKIFRNMHEARKVYKVVTFFIFIASNRFHILVQTR